MTYEPHELSLAFPDMSPDQFRRLADDIKANGLNHPIVLFEGKILDGRHRYKACMEVGVAPRFRKFHEGDPDEYNKGDPVAYVQSENAARRQLSESQLAYAITHPNIVEFERRRARERQESALKKGNALPLVSSDTNGDSGRVAEKLAAKAGVGTRTVNKAIKVREEGIQEVNEAVAKGEVSLNMAEKIAKLNPSAQRRVIETPAPQRGDALQEALNRSDAAARRCAREHAPVVARPGTPFVRKFLSAIERLAMLCAEEGVKDGGDIAKKFMDEMDWESLPLTLQLERAEPVVKALSIIRQPNRAEAA